MRSLVIKQFAHSHRRGGPPLLPFPPSTTTDDDPGGRRPTAPSSVALVCLFALPTLLAASSMHPLHRSTSPRLFRFLSPLRSSVSVSAQTSRTKTSSPSSSVVVLSSSCASPEFQPLSLAAGEGCYLGMSLCKIHSFCLFTLLARAAFAARALSLPRVNSSRDNIT